MLTAELKQILENVPRDFYGSIEIAYQAGLPGVVRTTRTQRLTTSNSSRESDRGPNVRPNRE